MNPTITVFERSPDKGQGLARDMRVRWALEEVGQPYDVQLASFAQLKEPAHRARNPFGQIPTYEQGELTLFESGAIVLHIAQQHAGLLPDDADARTRAVMWMFAALSTVEPPIVERSMCVMFDREQPWFDQRLAAIGKQVRQRLDELTARLGEAEWLDAGFSAGDLIMVHVLLRLRSSGILDEFPSLSAYISRAEARPAYRRAFEAQRALFLASTGN